MLGIWEKGQVLFFPSVLSSAGMMRNTSFDFGIMPLPKADETQKAYRTFILENVTILAVPPTADAEVSGTVIEALSAIGYNELSSVYYDTALKDKYSRDTDTREMLDTIRESVYSEYPL